MMIFQTLGVAFVSEPIFNLMQYFRSVVLFVCVWTFAQFIHFA